VMNGKNALRKPRDDDDLAQKWAVAKLHDEAQQIRTALNELDDLGNADWTAALSLWQLQWDGLRFVAGGLSDPAQRASFEAILHERKKAMDAILVRVVRMRRAG
jgi:hypothetical protein